MAIPWVRIVFGVLASILFAIIGLGVIIGMVIVFSSAASITDVQKISSFSVVMRVMLGLGCAWGAFVALRPLQRAHVLAGGLVGLVVGLLSLIANPGPFISGLLTLFLTLTAGIVGSRLAQLNPRGDGS